MQKQAADPTIADLSGGLTDFWTCGFRAWATYLAALASARGLDDMIAAQTKLYLESCGLAGEAAGEMLRRHGLTSPTLNEP